MLALIPNPPKSRGISDGAWVKDEARCVGVNPTVMTVKGLS